MNVNDRQLVRLGLLGAIVAAVCCFTPVLVLILGAAGLSAIVGGLDYLLFPALFASLGVISQALYLRSGSKGPSPRSAIFVIVITLSILLFCLEFRFAPAVSLAAAAMVAGYATYLRASRDEASA